MKKIISRKLISVVLYVGYAVVLTLFILFGTDVAPAIKRVLTNIMYTNKIHDVTLDLDITQPLIAGKFYAPTYQADNKTLALGPGFLYQSLDEGFTVFDTGAIYAEPDFEVMRIRFCVVSSSKSGSA